jgi:hypothetical protein
VIEANSELGPGTWDIFDLLGIPVYDAAVYGWIPANSTGYGPTWGWATDQGVLIATSMLYTTMYWGPLVYLGDAFMIFSGPQWLTTMAPNPFEGHSIGPLPPPKQLPPPTTWETEMMSVGCAANAEPGLITNNVNEVPGSYPGMEVDIRLGGVANKQVTTTIYGRTAVTSTVPIMNPNPEALEINEWAGPVLWLNNMGVCKAGVVNGH